MRQSTAKLNGIAKEGDISFYLCAGIKSPDSVTKPQTHVHMTDVGLFPRVKANTMRRPR